jgi:hypothetical protein
MTPDDPAPCCRGHEMILRHGDKDPLAAEIRARWCQRWESARRGLRPPDAHNACDGAHVLLRISVGLGPCLPKAKYESGTTPKELTITTAAAHIHFEPRIWLAGRRLMSMTAAVLRPASATAATMISLRLRLLRSLHCRLAAMTFSAYHAELPDRLHLTSVRQPHYLAMVPRRGRCHTGCRRSAGDDDGPTSHSRPPCAEGHPTKGKIPAGGPLLATGGGPPALGAGNGVS